MMRQHLRRWALRILGVHPAQGVRTTLAVAQVYGDENVYSQHFEPHPLFSTAETEVEWATQDWPREGEVVVDINCLRRMLIGAYLRGTSVGARIYEQTEQEDTP